MFNRAWFVDTAERVLVTFAESAIGVWVLAGPGDLFSLDVAEGAAAAGLIAGLSLLKSILAAGIGNKDSASLAASVPPPVAENPVTTRRPR
jgi:hypothetical protein